MLRFLLILSTLLAFPFALLAVGFDIGKTFIEFHMKALYGVENERRD